MNNKQLWEDEYTKYKIIPSSTRTLPSKALVLFSELLNFSRFKRVLDAGCGNGRNSIYLAQKGCLVDSVDLSPSALSELEKEASTLGIRDNIRIYNASLGARFPFEEESYDLVLDSYVLCHFIDDDFRFNYRKQLHRVAKRGGLVFSSLFDISDEYYRRILETEGCSGNIVTDPNNGVTKRLYTESEIISFFSVDFRIRYFVKFEFTDIVLGEPYVRSILALVLEK